MTSEAPPRPGSRFPQGPGGLVLAGALALALACGGGQGGAPPSGVAVALSPPGPVAVRVSGTVAFTATVRGTDNPAVTWRVDGVAGGAADLGTIDGGGTYTAPAVAGSHTVTATSVADATRSASATVRVQAATAVSVALAAVGPAHVVVSGATLVTAEVANSADPSVTWQVDGVTGGDAGTGTILAPVVGNRVVYRAPALPGRHTITATSRADPGQSAALTLEVTPSAAGSGTIPVGAEVRQAPYGAAGDGVSDDTAALARAIQAVAGTGRAVHVPAGTYLIDGTANNGSGLLLGSDMALVLDPGATFKAIPAATMHYGLVTARGAHNLVISGGTFIGSNDAQAIPTPTTVEDGFAIKILGGSNVVVERVVAEKCFCDGIYVAAGARDVVLSGVTATANRRHGMAIVDASGVLVLGSTFSANTGSVEVAGGPLVNGCGIDLEPNAGEAISEVLVYGCTFADNRLAGLGWGVAEGSGSGASTAGVFAIDNTANGNGRGLDVENCAGSAIVGNRLDGNLGFGIFIHDGASGTVCRGNTVKATGTAGDGAGIECYLDQGTLLDGNVATGNAEYGILAVQSTGTTITGNTATGNGTAGIHVYRCTGVTQSGNVTQ